MGLFFYNKVSFYNESKYQRKSKDKISEDLSPTRNLTGLHLKIVAAIAILWTFFQLWYASPFLFGLILECLKGFQQELFI